LAEPLSPEEACKCYRSFVLPVYDAITEFHKDRYAHLNIRLPNVCFGYNSETHEWYAALIDLDRSIQTSHTVQYGNSVIYWANLKFSHLSQVYRQSSLMGYFCEAYCLQSVSTGVNRRSSQNRHCLSTVHIWSLIYGTCFTFFFYIYTVVVVVNLIYAYYTFN